MDTTGKVINCTAAVAWDAGDQLSVEEIEVDPPKTGEVRVRIIATGVCQIDSYTLSGRNPDALYPVILGHEGAGVVESVGPGVTTVRPGDHVIPLSVPQCKTCKFCLNPKTNLCPTASSTQIRGVMPDGTTRFRCRGNMVYHFMGCSTFSEYTVVLEISLCKISKAAPLDRVCLLACSVPIGYGAALNTAKVEPSSNCAIFGLGAIGLAVALGCKAAGAKRIIGVDVDPKKHEIAKRFGVNEFINPLDYIKPVHQVLINKTDGGLDYTFECSGDVKTMRTALESCHKGWGVSVVLAVATAKDEIKTLPFQLVMGRTWKGAAFGGYKSRDGIPKLVDEYMDNKLPLDNFVTHDLPLEDISEAFHLMHCGKSIRSVVHMSRALRPHYACCREISGHFFQYSKHG